jgi:hypothetical protein
MFLKEKVILQGTRLIKIHVSQPAQSIYVRWSSLVGKIPGIILSNKKLQLCRRSLRTMRATIIHCFENNVGMWSIVAEWFGCRTLNQCVADNFW